ASTAAAALILLGRWRGVGAAAVQWLSWLDSRALVLELLVLIALVVSLGPVARIWLNAWGVLLMIGVVLAGILLPLTLHARLHEPGGPTQPRRGPGCRCGQSRCRCGNPCRRAAILPDSVPGTDEPMLKSTVRTPQSAVRTQDVHSRLQAVAQRNPEWRPWLLL